MLYAVCCIRRSYNVIRYSIQNTAYSILVTSRCGFLIFILILGGNDIKRRALQN
jgi:hypothetical protein